MKYKNVLRYVNFKIVNYDLHNGNVLIITPIPFGDESGYNLRMDNERFLIEALGDLDAANINDCTLQNFASFLSDHLQAMKRLT